MGGPRVGGSTRGNTRGDERRNQSGGRGVGSGISGLDRGLSGDGGRARSGHTVRGVDSRIARRLGRVRCVLCDAGGPSARAERIPADSRRNGPERGEHRRHQRAGASRSPASSPGHSAGHAARANSRGPRTEPRRERDHWCGGAARGHRRTSRGCFRNASHSDLRRTAGGAVRELGDRCSKRTSSFQWRGLRLHLRWIFVCGWVQRGDRTKR